MSAESNFIELFEKGVTNASVPDGATLVVAFSGGPDSSAVLAALAELRQRRDLTIVAVHINHQIRPTSSNKDQIGAEAIAKKLDVEFVTIEVDVPSHATSHNISIESAARVLRYRTLANIASSHSAFGVVTGHTRDDQAETVLLHASRGSGLKGIAGMSYNSILRIPDSDVELRVLRPMLDIAGSNCVEFCAKAGINPVIDDSNSSRDYTRNKLRLDVLPLLNSAIPEASQSLARLAKNASGDIEIIDWVVERHLTVAAVTLNSYSRFTVEDLPGSLVARMLMRAYENHVGHSQNLERTHVDAMTSLLAGQSGTSIELPNAVEFYVDKELFGFRFNGENDCPYPEMMNPIGLQLPGTHELGGRTSISTEIIDRPDQLHTGDRHITFASPELAELPLQLRNRRNGDRFQPLGMEPQVKLQDFFVGAGVPERWRDRVLIVDSDNGIIWIAGYRLAEWAKVRPEHTQVTKLELSGVKVGS